MQVITTRGRKPRWRRAKTLIGALITTAALVGAVQVLAPASAMAMTDIGCEDVGECSGGEGNGSEGAGGADDVTIEDGADEVTIEDEGDDVTIEDEADDDVTIEDEGDEEVTITDDGPEDAGTNPDETPTQTYERELAKAEEERVNAERAAVRKNIEEEEAVAREDVTIVDETPAEVFERELDEGLRDFHKQRKALQEALARKQREQEEAKPQSPGKGQIPGRHSVKRGGTKSKRRSPPIGDMVR